MEILGSIPSKNNIHKISKRCLRCFDEQQWYAKNFLLKFIGDENVVNQNILEIGCAEAGLLKFYYKEEQIVQVLSYQILDIIMLGY